MTPAQQIMRAIESAIRPLRNRVANLVARAVLNTVDDAKKMQILQASLGEGETRDELERFQNYGFTSHPVPGAEAVTLSVGGRRDHVLVIAVDDRRYRLTALAEGEVAVYDQTGSSVVLKANGDLELTPSSGVTTITGDVTVTGTLTATTDVIGGGKSLKTHTHPYTDVSDAGTANKTTGAPT